MTKSERAICDSIYYKFITLKSLSPSLSHLSVVRSVQTIKFTGIQWPIQCTRDELRWQQ